MGSGFGSGIGAGGTLGSKIQLIINITWRSIGIK
jgi:hypothetical protein